MKSLDREVVGRQRVLVVDDEDATRKLVSRVLCPLGVEITEALAGREALSAATLTKPSLVLLDLGLPDVDGLELLRMLRNEHPALPVVVVSGASSVDAVVDAMRMGARDYVTKPFEPQRLRVAVANGLQHLALGKRVEELEQCIDQSHPFDGIVGCSSSMGALFSTMKKLAVSSATVLIQGETGVGKELVARALHFKGKRGKGPFVELNCAAIPASLLENELFGHESEAFTGANHRRAGRIELADGGTLFLDEIGELDLASQAKLL
ncbi:MAG: sigma-54-dependent transcriptional regulator, partial [Candidatus Binatia bacterium]